jgi:hypothetical protein
MTVFRSASSWSRAPVWVGIFSIMVNLVDVSVYYRQY